MKTTSFKSVLLGVSILLATIATAQTIYTTKAPGNWSDPSIWAGGVVPNPTIRQTDIVVIKHTVTFNYPTTNLQVSGGLYVVGDTLRFPAGYSGQFKLSNAAVGLVVKNAAVEQNFSSSTSDFISVGSGITIENASFAISQDFMLQNGATCRMTNSTIKVGGNFALLGNATQRSKDTIQYTSVTAAMLIGGNFSVTYGDLSVANADIRLKNGDFINSLSGSITTAPGAASNYAFDVLKAGNIQNDGVWNGRVYSYCVTGSVTGSRAADIDFVRPQDCTLPPPPPSSTNGQMVINEVYTEPATGNNEFLELYNINNQPEQLDNYTLVTYFDNGTQKGFYVFDFPKAMVLPKGLYVASSSFPINYQGVSNSLNASFNWNKANQTTSGSLKKWVYTGGTGNLNDGNVYYDEAALPADFNDLFFRITGDVAYTFLLYKNGILINKIIAGASGSIHTLSTSITSLPKLFVDMQGTSPDFTIDFGSYAGMPVEAITADAGNDNGFTRTADGACGTFKKSSNATRHTPLQSNGPISVNTTGDVTINSSIKRGTTILGSTVTYTVIAPLSALPVDLRIIVDDGAVPGQLDVLDTQIDYQTATTSGQTFTTTFNPYDKDIFILVKQGVGCIDRLVMPTVASSIVLPVAFGQFTAAYNQGTTDLRWTTEAETNLQYFVVQRSTDGKTYTDIGVALPAEKSNNAYTFKDQNAPAGTPVYYYRMKAVFTGEGSSYSAVRIVRPATAGDRMLQLTVYPNPVTDKLTVSFPTQWQGKAIRYELYNANGTLLRSGLLPTADSNLTLNMTSSSSGLYLLKAFCGTDTTQQRIVKQ